MCSEINSFDATLTFVHSAEKKFGLCAFMGQPYREPSW